MPYAVVLTMVLLFRILEVFLPECWSENCLLTPRNVMIFWFTLNKRLVSVINQTRYYIFLPFQFIFTDDIIRRCVISEIQSVLQEAINSLHDLAMLSIFYLFLDYLTTLSLTPFGGGFEYLHRSPESRRRRRKWNPLPGGITGPPCFWGT
jgi:hypothetical protein